MNEYAVNGWKLNILGNGKSKTKENGIKENGACSIMIKVP